MKLRKITAFLMVVLMMISATPPSTFAEIAEGAKATDTAGQYHRVEALLERGSVSYTYDLGYTSAHYKSYVRTAYDVKTGGATRVALELPDVARGTVYIQFFASDYTKISSTAYSGTAAVAIPSTCDFIRVEIQTSADLETIGIRFYDGADTPKEVKRAGVNAMSEKLTYKVSDDLHTTARLMLPPNYTIDGEKVPLILWLEGSGSSLSTWGGDFNSNKLPYLQYLRDEGFAVLSIYAWGNEYAEKYPKCGNSFPYPIPTNLACIREGIKYVCDRYNVDADNLHIMSKSQGGQCALYYASCNELNAKSIGMFAPVLDYLSMPGEAMYKDTRAAIAEDLDLTGDIAYFGSDRFLSYSDEGRAFLRENLDKLLIMNEAWTNLSGATPEELFASAMDDCETFWTEKLWTTDRTDIYTHTEYVKTASVPVKIWGAQDDAATPYLKMVEVVAQLKNGGSVAELRTLPKGTGGHSCADGGTTRVDVTTALGIEYKSVPIGWVENVEWIRQYSHTHTYTTAITTPTCTDEGYTTYTCACGDRYVDDYVDAVGHHFASGVCTQCGKEYVFSILGDSISTFAGWIPVADGVNLAHRPFYPNSAITTVEQTWWYQVLDTMGARLGINDSWSGSWVINTLDKNSGGDLGPDAAMASMTRIRNLGSNGTPDVILFFGGTNDLVFDIPLGSFDPATAPTTADLTQTKWDTFAEAYVAAILRMQHLYPDAQIVAIQPGPNKYYYTEDTLLACMEITQAICSHYGVVFCDLLGNGFTSDMLADVTHPNAAGMTKIADIVTDCLTHKHTYSGDFDTHCNECGALREVDMPIAFGGNSISEDVSGLAFRFDVVCEGMAQNVTTAIYDNATVGGYRLLSMGAVVTNGIDSTDIAAVHLLDLTENTAGFAVRLINIPLNGYDTAVTATPYIVLEIDGVATTIYGTTQTCSYNAMKN